MLTSLDAILWFLNVWKSVPQIYSIKSIFFCIAGLDQNILRHEGIYIYIYIFILAHIGNKVNNVMN